MGFVIARVGFLIRPDYLSMRCCLTVVFKAASFGTGIPGERRIPGKGEALEFVPSLCPHSPSKRSPLPFKIRAASFPNSPGEKGVGKVALAAGSDSNKRAARRSPKILQVFSELNLASEPPLVADLTTAELAQRVPSPAAPAADCQTTDRTRRIRRWWLGSSGGGVRW